MNRTLVAAALTLLSLSPAWAGQEDQPTTTSSTISAQGNGHSKAPTGASRAANFSSAADPEQQPKVNTRALETERDEAAPSIREIICQTITSAAEAHDLPVVFFTRLIWQESKFDPQAVSRAGAQGVAQFMPKVAAAMGLRDPFDPEQALPMSARLLRELHGRFGNWGLAAAAYNAGTRRVREWLDKRGKLPKETRNYVQTITGVSAERWTNPGPKNLEMPPAKAPCPDLPEAEVHMAGMAVPLPPTRPRQTLVAANDAVGETQPDAPDEVSASARRKPGSWRVRLRSHGSERQAEAALERLRKRRPGIVDAHAPTIVDADANDNAAGRKRVQFLADSRASAKALCAELRPAVGTCLVERN